jgi:C-terminal processing protease CtpA/Prc
MTGMVLAAAGQGRRRVDAVIPGSPAEAAGVQPGDVLIAIDDRPLAEMSYDDVRRSFQRDGAELRLTLERNAAHIDTTLRLRRMV